MSSKRGAGLVLLAAVTIFVSAFLLFQVQPLISKKILPWFGGSPAVWTTCMLFFQVLLLAGYTYAHLLTKYVPARWQGPVHAVLLVLAVMTLPIIPSNWWKPDDGTWPAMRILLLLVVKVGAPYFLLSTTGPLIQAWFALANPGRSPYRLYALSNVGSLGALLTYPFVVEPLLSVNWQGWLWSGAFVGFAALAGAMGLWIWRIAADLERQGFDTTRKAGGDGKYPSSSASPRWYHQVGWLVLAALPSMTFLAITNHLCQDVAPVPLLFIVPLSLYLLTLIICFDREIWYSRVFFGLFGALAIALLCALERPADLDQALITIQSSVGLGELPADEASEPADADDVPVKRRGSLWRSLRSNFPLTFTGTMNELLDVPENVGVAINRRLNTNYNWSLPFTVEDYDEDVYFQAIMYLTVLFFGCMLCHGELVKSKPAPTHLTKYYLLISAGGACGGLFVALISPSLFVRPYELPLGIVGCFAVAMLALFGAGRALLLARRELLQWSAAFVFAGCLIFVAASQLKPPGDKEGVEIVTRKRNFYGAIEVRESDTDDENGESHVGRALYHGRILHGFQYLSDSRIDQITTYYGPNSGPGIAVRHHPRRTEGQPLKVAVVGLGTGTMAGYAQAGDYFCFYDIDPKIKQLHDEGVFQFVQRARQRGAQVDIVLGDARLSMEREARDKSKQYDLIVLDAFSGDAIPAHLLTLEAVKVYDDLLSRDASGQTTGILAVHISNRYLDLAPVVDALAEKYQFEQVPVDDNGGSDEWDTSSNWVLLTRNEEFLQDVVVKAAIAEGTPAPEWHVLQPASFVSSEGSRGRIQNDGSILVSGTAPDKDTYVVRLKTSLSDIEALKIEALSDESLPGQGPGRGHAKQPNFILQKIELLVEESGQPRRTISFREASADFSAPSYDVAGAIDNDPNTGWGIAPQFGKAHHATFTAAELIPEPRRRTLVIRLEQHAGGGQTIGKFRISVLAVDKKIPVLWTDQFSNLLDILK